MKTLNQTSNEYQYQEFILFPLPSLGTPYESTSTTEWYKHYIYGGYVGMLVGKINKNLECITIYTNGKENNCIMQELVDQLPPQIFQYLSIKEFEGNYHLFYLNPDIEIGGNEFLARHEDGSVMIEILGEGDFIPFQIQKDIHYQFVQDLYNLEFEFPTLSTGDREILINVCRSLTRFYPPYNFNNKIESLPVVQDFNHNFDVIKLFKVHGWNDINEGTRKVCLKGPSSRLYNAGSYFPDQNTFYAHADCIPFNLGQSYSHYQIFKILEGIEDNGNALKLLSLLGYS